MSSRKTQWNKKRVLLPLGGLLLLAAACGAAPDEPAGERNALLTRVEEDLPQATSTTAEQVSTPSTEAPTTTSTVPPTTAPAPPPTTAAPRPPVTTTARPAPTTMPAPPPTAAPTTAAPAPASSTYYANCDAARAAGAAPLHTGDPGYRSGLDRDHDGVACE